MGIRLIPALAVVLAGFLVRSANLLRMPLFFDEAAHVTSAQEIAGGDPFAGLQENKWLFAAAVALFRPTGTESVWVARAVAALAAAVTVSACVALGTFLGDRRVVSRPPSVGLTAGALYALLPMAVFHERQALVESQAAALTALSTWLVVLLARRPTAGLGILLGIALAAAYLTKLLALPYLGLPVLGALILSRQNRPARRTLAVALFSMALAGALIWGAYEIAASHGVTPGETFRPTLANTVFGSQRFGPGLRPAAWANALFERLAHEVASLRELIGRYVGWPAFLLALSSGVWAFADRRRPALYLMFPAFAFAALPMLALPTTGGEGGAAPRYYLPNLAPLAALAAYALWRFLARLRGVGAKGFLALASAAHLALLLPAAVFDLALVRAPDPARLTNYDRIAYAFSFAGDFSATARLLTAEWQAQGGRQLKVIGSSLDIAFLRAHLGPRVAQIVRFPAEVNEDIIRAWLLDGDPVYHVRAQCHQGDLPWLQPPDLEAIGLSLVEPRLLSDCTGEVTLYHIEGYTGDKAEALIANHTPLVGKLDEAFAQLAASNLAARVFVFPAAHTQSLAARTARDVQPLRMDAWPVTPDRVALALSKLPAQSDGEAFDLVMVNRAGADPGALLATAMHDRFFRVDSAEFGMLERTTYVSGPTEYQATPVNAVFAGVIRLTSARLFDPQLRAGQFARIALTWQTDVPVQDSFHVFAHVIARDGSLWAQHDGIPGGWLRPMTDWVPGSSVSDRFAIRLPADMPPGDYEVRVGLYRPDALARLPATAGTDIGPDYALIGRIQIVK